jgi:hypothetical protein
MHRLHAFYNATPDPGFAPSDLIPTQTEHDVLPAPIIIGYVLSNGITRHDKLKCHQPPCSGVTFKRIQDLKRHNNARHNRHAARFWCPVDGCPRSIKSGGNPFPRKDKMIDHLERAHADKVGSGANTAGLVA